MSLLFADGVSDRVDVAASASTNNLVTATVLMCVNLDSVVPGAQRNLWGKSLGANRFIGIVGATGLVQTVYAGSTSNANATADVGNLPNFGASKWCFVAATVAFGTAAPHLYTGDLTHPLAEVAAYTTQTNGSGTHDDSADVWSWMSASGGNNSYGGKLAFVMVWNRALTLRELIEQQFRPHKTSGNVLYFHAGFNGVGTQTDWSGNGNAGTVTGAIVAPHVPLGPPFGIGLAHAPKQSVAVVSNIILMGEGLT